MISAASANALVMFISSYVRTLACVNEITLRCIDEELPLVQKQALNGYIGSVNKASKYVVN
jgi:hypothetical protein